MKKIKILSLILAVLMLAGMATLFSSCAKTEPGVITPSEDTVDVDVSEYTVLYGDSQSGSKFTGTVRGYFDVFVEKLSAATGKSFKLKQASRTDVEEGAKEILLGATDREESVKALEKISGDGFAIQVLENKIVIVGTNNLYTVMAMDYFVKNYLSGEEKSETLTINETVKANEMTSVELTNSAYKSEDAENAYTYVYKNGLGMIPSPYVNLSSDVTSKAEYQELPMIIADKVIKTTAGAVGLAQKFFPIGTDAVTKEKEILIGITGRTETKEALSEIDETQYIITVRGERVVIAAWSNYILNQAAEAYNDLIKEATVKDADGNTKICLPRGFRMVIDGEHKWVTDFPKPEGEGVELSSTMDNNDNSLQYVYTGSGVNKAAYDAYVAQLKAAGYTEVKNAGTEAEGSVFKFFTHKGKNVALYVALNAFAHKNDFAEFDDTIIKQIDGKIITPYDFESTIRIISSTIEDAYLPDATLLSGPSCNYVTDTKLTAMPIYHKAVGMCHIITLEDGSFIVYDGGGENPGSREYDTLWNLLCELHTQVTNAAPSADNKIRIAAWVLSHAHWDHYTAFSKMLELYGKTGKIEMDYMIANVPSAEAYCAGNNFSEVANVMTPDDIQRLQNRITGGFTLIKPHTGMQFSIGNVHFETITTWEDLSPVMCSNTNDTNTVFRLTITSNNSDEKTTLMWLGDANRLQSRFMCATFGTYLKSDMSTIAHHGNAGVEIDLYEMIDPETYFWMHNTAAVQSYLNPANKGWINQVDQHIAYEQESVKRIFANGAQNVLSDVSSGLTPPTNGFFHISFENGVADFDNVKELHFSWQQIDGKWVAVGRADVSDLQHTDISAGAAGFHANPAGTMTFCSNYMVKCVQGCPTDYHAH